ncbi:MAG: hypothetical protein HS115_07635 [Spirochaetales bacterium]|nr:hypothetical protein [Spirochaetales bacterium]
MRFFRGVIFFFLAGALMADDRGRFALPAEVSGYWQMIPLSAELQAKNKINPFPLPHQYFAFYADGSIVVHMSSHKTGHTAGSMDRLKKILPVVSSYTFENGFMVIRYRDTGATERWAVNIFSKSFTSGGTDFEKGDILMSLDDGAGNPVYRRLLRRIPVADGKKPADGV